MPTDTIPEPVKNPAIDAWVATLPETLKAAYVQTIDTTEGLVALFLRVPAKAFDEVFTKYEVEPVIAIAAGDELEDGTENVSDYTGLVLPPEVLAAVEKEAADKADESVTPLKAGGLAELDHTKTSPTADGWAFVSPENWDAATVQEREAACRTVLADLGVSPKAFVAAGAQMACRLSVAEAAQLPETHKGLRIAKQVVESRTVLCMFPDAITERLSPDARNEVIEIMKKLADRVAKAGGSPDISADSGPPMLMVDGMDVADFKDAVAKMLDVSLDGDTDYGFRLSAGTHQFEVDAEDPKSWELTYLRDVPVNEADDKKDDPAPSAEDKKKLATGASAWIVKNMFDEFMGAVARPVALYTARGEYDHEKAPLLARKLTLAGCKACYRAGGGKGPWFKVYTPDVREKVMVQLRDAAEKMRKDDAVVAMLPKKYQPESKTNESHPAFADGDHVIAVWQVPGVGTHAGHAIVTGTADKHASVRLLEHVTHKGGGAGYPKGLTLRIPVEPSVRHWAPYYEGLHATSDVKARKLTECDAASARDGGWEVVRVGHQCRATVGRRAWMLDESSVQSVVRVARRHVIPEALDTPRMDAALATALKLVCETYGVPCEAPAACDARPPEGLEGLLTGVGASLAQSEADGAVSVYNLPGGVWTTVTANLLANGWTGTPESGLSNPGADYRVAVREGALVVFRGNEFPKYLEAA